MKILVIGSGGREHALVRALKRSQSAGEVICAPGSDGIAQDVRCVNAGGNDAILNLCRTESIDLVVVGPEQPLVDGLADLLRAAGFAVFGPGAKGAQLEASKDFTKKLCDRMRIPTARYATFDALGDALAYIAQHGAPVVVKADGLAAGKGVTVAMTAAEAEKAVRDCFGGAFGESGSRVVLEEFLSGEEASFFALCDGKRALAFAGAQDHKRAYDNDEGPNTGGMGAYSPAPVIDEAMQARIMKEMIAPTVDGLTAQGIPYIGVLFAGIMLTGDGPKLIEYNCRFGDPETQVMLARFEGDLAALLMSCAKGALDASHLKFSEDAALCVVMAAKGYPGAYEKGTPIAGLDAAAEVPGVSVLHAGTVKDGETWKANGGRVLNIVARAPDLQDAYYAAYRAADKIDWKQGFYRRDIGWRALKS
ncbi:MAG: phosphoribosylamine--glycine ligase [Alphaproteobacteria bacterium]